MSVIAPAKPPPGRVAGAVSGGSARGAAVLVALGAWSIAVPYLARALGLRLEVGATVEIVDHVVPGLVVLAAAGLHLALVRRGRAGGLLSLSAVCTVCLAGLWITATHVPLLADAAAGRVAWGTACLHAASGPVILALGLWLVGSDLADGADAPPDGARRAWRGRGR